MKKTIELRDPRKGFYAEVVEDFSHIVDRKTIKVRPLENRIWVPKLKRFYQDYGTKYSVHYDPSELRFNPLGLKGVSKGDKVFCTNTRRISKTKSYVALLYDPLKSTQSDYRPVLIV